MEKLKPINLKFEDGVWYETWKTPQRASLTQEYVKAIEKMEVDQSFEFHTEKWSVIESVRSAFKLRGWKCATQSKSPRKTGKEYWTFRVWRIK